MHRGFLIFLAGLMMGVPVVAQEIAQPAAQNVETELAPTEAWGEDRTIVFDARDIDLADFQWIARPVVVFADSTNDPAFQRQMELLRARPEALADRDVVVVTDTDASELSDIRRKLRPRGFMLVLMGKDGGVKLRKPFPWDVREISRSIDKMPMRLQEMRERSSATP
ncbi:DUF4174 domain-containing protein [Palleronia sp. LCG004]|uniref:DUF4174 domain-containing protein n=1 Tax=Palleronia sp. LCG004 TaxID=3079304 RepID=UPI002941D713|nr:DUF4174 domain-containing protein [Palleronia sp. LCG004]WOI55350.1 DUF4174 domain-containing protein [Palleronia sp. LCG004]